uniref:L1 transposable element RRM domain-containing protein n=1 Tax=Poecilia formosa TaxID=48698 RepID=A0A087XKJ2_POEFO
SGKNKTMDGYIGGANANEANANVSSGHTGGTESEPRDSAPGEKTRLLEMCQEICKTMSASILAKLDECFDALEAKFQSVLAAQTDLQNRMVSQELATKAHEKCMGELETKFQTKLLDLEARSRRHNIKIVGIKENSEEGRPTEFVSKLIPELLGKQHFPHPLKVDRAHRSLWPKPAACEKPRTIIARIHQFQSKEQILRLARTQPMEYKGNKVLIFPDYTSEVMSQRRAFRNAMQALIKFQLRYPARLLVQWQ